MKTIIPLLLLVAAASALAVEPVITATDFLDTSEPKRMNRIYIDSVYGNAMTMFAKPTGGAIGRV